MTRWQLRIAALTMLGASAALAQLAEPAQSAGPLVASAAPAPGLSASGAMTTERLRAARVEDAGGVPLGAIRDFVLVPDASGEGIAGQISHVVLELGGVMGLGRHAVAVPYSELQMIPGTEGQLRIRLPWTEAQLRSVPAWDAANPASLGLSGPSDPQAEPVPLPEAP